MPENSNSARTSQIDTEDLVKAIRQRKYESNSWSLREQAYRHRSRRRDPVLEDREVSFTTGLLVLLRRSMFGGFLKRLNQQQLQNKSLNETKLAILNWDMKSFSYIDQQQFMQENSFTEHLYQLLLQAVRDRDVIDYDFLYKRMKTLRATSLYINVLDDMPRNFTNLEVLVLSANWLKEVPGESLPRKLKFLELYGNQIEDLKSISRKAPPQLQYLGLGRNKLSDKSQIHLLGNCKKFGALCCLDLSENDIYDLLTVVNALSRLKQLQSLQLEGNPCYVQSAYKHIALKHLPTLVYLDGTEILEEDRDIMAEPEAVVNEAAIVFTCHRIIGLPPPPKETGVNHTIHVEVKLPLVEEIITEQKLVEEPVVEVVEPKADSIKEKKKTGKEEAVDVQMPSKSPKNGARKKQINNQDSPYEAPDEYADELKKGDKNMSFKTERVPWAKVIQFPEETIVVEHPTNDLKAIRDTFRSVINVKIIYLKVGAPGVKKGKKNEVEQKHIEKVRVESPIAQEEVILKKVTLASFHCELCDVNWSDATIDFYWANHPKCNPVANRVEGSLRSLCYIAEKEAAPTKSPSSEEPKGKIPLPNIFTCQVGFGLKRF
ncbi:hypothetical protein Trydic_g8126 [Trypoxylus dichotomus]